MLKKFEKGYKYSEAKKLVSLSLQKGLSVFLWGHPGIGKSTMAKELAKELALPLIDIRLAQSDPSEIGGILYPDKEQGRSVWLKPDWLPLEKPAFIFLDEINAAVTKLHQSIAYQIVLEKRLRNWEFAPGTVVLAAGNLEEDAAIVQALSQALSNRFVHFQLRPDVDEWIKWAKKSQIVEPVRSYISFKREEGLYNNTGDRSFPSPRSWEFASKLIEDELENKKPRTEHLKELLESTVGYGEATAFASYFKNYKKINIEKFIFKGEVPKALKSTDPSFIHVTLTSMASFYSKNYKKIKKEHFANIIKYFSQTGITKEHVVLFLYMLNQDGIKDFSGRKDSKTLLKDISKILTKILKEKLED